MDLAVHTLIDKEKCIGCGACIRVCPYETLSLVDGKAHVTGRISLNCGHCMAACPTGAINVASLDRLTAKTYVLNEDWIGHGSVDTAKLVRLMASLRSCRRYLSKPVAKEILEDLVTIGTTAPSGSNSQEWTFTILPDRKQVEALAAHTVRYFRRINALSEIRILRAALYLLGQKKLQAYYTRYHDVMEKRLADWDKSGHDFIFYGATSALMVGSTEASTCPKEDALTAAQNIRLAAHAMGLGSCLIGYAVQAVNAGRPAAGAVGLLPGEAIHCVIAIGWPDEKYVKTIARKRITPRYTDIY